MGDACSCDRTRIPGDDLVWGDQAPKEAPNVGVAGDGFGWTVQEEAQKEQGRKKALEKALTSSFPFQGFDVACFDADKDEHKFTLTSEAAANLKALATALKACPKTCIRVCAHVAPLAHLNSAFLSLAMARFVRETLQKNGCKNIIAAQGAGVSFYGHTGIELAKCEAEEAASIDEEMNKLENSFEVRLAKVLRLDISFEGVDLNKFDPDKDVTEFNDVASKNLDRIAQVLDESPDTCIRIFGYCGPPSHPNCVKLSHVRAQRVREALHSRGALSTIAAMGLGLVDGLGPRCELAVCTMEEIVKIRGEVAAMDAVMLQGNELQGNEAPAALVIGFENKPKAMGWKGKEVEISLLSRPLGLTFSEDVVPVKITKLVKDGYAMSRGVKVGMAVKSVNGQSAVGMQYPEIFELLKRGTELLPSSD